VVTVDSVVPLESDDDVEVLAAPEVVVDRDGLAPVVEVEPLPADVCVDSPVPVGRGAAPGGVAPGDKSLLWKLIWIMGANMVKGPLTFWANGIPALSPAQVATVTTVWLATRVQVCPPMLAQPYPLRVKV
jgi:hypothetical protein